LAVWSTEGEMFDTSTGDEGVQPLRDFPATEAGSVTRGASWRPVAVGLAAVDTAAMAVSSMVALHTLLATAIAVCSVLLFNLAGGLYRFRQPLSVLDQCPALTGFGLVAALSGAIVSLRFDGAAAGDLGHRHVLIELSIAVGSYTLIDVFGRVSLYAAVRASGRASLRNAATLIVGSDNVGRRTADSLLNHPEYRMQPIGFVDGGSEDVTDLPLPLLGTTEDVLDLIATHKIRSLIVAFGAIDEAGLLHVIRAAGWMRCAVFIIPRFHELSTTGPRVAEHIEGIPVMRVAAPAQRVPTWRLKRATDVMASLVGLLVLSPLLATCALAVYAEGGSGVFFRQQRVGLEGGTFTVYKFRTLRPANRLESETRWNVDDDERIGPVGRFLRTSSLDELPQLWNVLLGTMTLVGPRPERPHFVAEFSNAFAHYASRHRVPPGITGLAQVHGLRGDTSIDDRARFDNYYIEHWSPWGDIKILIRTLGSNVCHVRRQRR
jgi:exopolysaccharide biosynthesis polyprenyl glycosylphosphotransferase